jgi:Reverse transcriptase (RNA-dependent DNA polymerase)
MIQYLITLMAFVMTIHSIAKWIEERGANHFIKIAAIWGMAVIMALTIELEGASTEPRHVPRSKRTWWGKLTIRWVNQTVDELTDMLVRNSKWLQRGTKTHRYYQTRSIAHQVAGTRGRHRLASAMAMAMVIAMEHRTNGKSLNMATFDTDSRSIGIDNRCTACISDNTKDFIGELKPSMREIKGFGGSRTTKVMIGTIKWKWLDDNGLEHAFTIPNSFYVPDGKVCLMSPQHWAQSAKNGRAWEETGSENCTLYWKDGKHKLVVPLGERDNVATLQLSPGYEKYMAFCAQAEIQDNHDEDPIIAMDSTLVSDDEDDDESDDEITNPAVPRREREKEQSGHDETESPESQLNTTEFDLNGPTEEDEQCEEVNLIEEDVQPTNMAAEILQIHHRMGHAPFAKLQEMAKQGALPRRLKNCPIPSCTACMYGKASRKPWRSKPRKNQPAKTKLNPGDMTSVDQMNSSTPGLVAQISGILTTKRYKCATVFVDQASRLGYIYPQKTSSAEETIEAKEAWEAFARTHGVTVKAYHADNGIFKANKWMQSCRNARQPLTFAGVNSHHENGIAERRIKEIQEGARTMLIQANRRWRSCINAHLWPYAVRMASEQVNCMPNMQREDKQTPMQVFSGSKVHSNIKHWHHFGSPVYVLEKELQTNSPFGKWKSRSKVGIYLGRSPQHSRNVALVLSKVTGLVSPQFHVKHDSRFQTVREEKQDTPAQWMVKAGFVGVAEPSDRGSKRLANGGKSPAGKRKGGRKGNNRQPEGAEIAPGNTGVVPIWQGPPEQEDREAAQGQQMWQMPELPAEPPYPNPFIEAQDEPAIQDEYEDEQAEPNNEEQTTTRSGRASKKAPRLIEAMLAEAMIAETKDNGSEVEGEIFCLEAMFPESRNDQADPLLAFKATTDPDTMYLHEAMREPDREEFKKAMVKEVKDQMDNKNFIIIKRSKVPQGEPVMPTVWQMKRKRDILTRAVKKWKARLNIDGSKMVKGLHYDESYSPVASWNSIRTMLLLAAQHNWHTVQLDYVLAFPQAPIERTLYMEIPKGFEIEGYDRKDYVLELHRNVYGSKNAGRTWYQYLCKKLVEEVGFVQSKIDKCVFYKGTVMYVLYTDDSVIAGPNKAEIEGVIEDIRRAKLDITIEGDIQDFLGINIDRKEDGTIHLTQPHLIDGILKDLRLDGPDVKIKSTPAKSSDILRRHQGSEAFDESFDYRSVIGKLNYLEKGTRADISYISHQCARFAVSPKKEHGEAIKWLGRYLKGTRDEGLILKPDGKSGLEVYVDADFVGNWDPDDTESRDSARSRHGYIIKFNGCPIVWKSQMATEIAMSSTESEYTGASYALREAIPIMDLLKEIKSHGTKIPSCVAKVHCRLYEDNSGALEILKKAKYRPRTRHLLVKLHHFRDYVTRGEISIHAIRTHDQEADYLTKPVGEEILKKLRKRVQGW